MLENITYEAAERVTDFFVMQKVASDDLKTPLPYGNKWGYNTRVKTIDIEKLNCVVHRYKFIVHYTEKNVITKVTNIVIQITMIV